MQGSLLCEALRSGVPSPPGEVSAHDDGNGTCSGGADEQDFCDGFTHPDGSGVISCWTNTDCLIVGPQAGDCTLFQTQKCFGNDGDSISVEGTFGAQEAAVFASRGTSTPCALTV